MKILGVKFRKVDRCLLKSFSWLLSAVTGTVSFAFIFWTPENANQKYWAAALVFVGIIVLFIGHWLRISNRKSTIIKVGKMSVSVGVGDIWTTAGLKVIAWNEFMDTQVDDKVIAKRSLHGKYILEHEQSIESLDRDITIDHRLNGNIVEKDVGRPFGGKTTRYKLGSIFERGDFLMLAFSKFDDTNQAYLTLANYVDCLTFFWKNLNAVYSMRDIAIPLMGSGITRFIDSAGQTMPTQSLLRMMLWTLWQSNCKFASPCRISIVLTEDALNKIDLLALEYSLMED